MLTILSDKFWKLQNLTENQDLEEEY